jgi:hypothetical protein
VVPEQRGADGTPSATDFLLQEMRAVIGLLADDFAGRTLAVAADPEIRVLITAGILMQFMSVYAVIAADDSVEIIYLDLG